MAWDSQVLNMQIFKTAKHKLLQKLNFWLSVQEAEDDLGDGVPPDDASSAGADLLP